MGFASNASFMESSFFYCDYNWCYKTVASTFFQSFFMSFFQKFIHFHMYLFLNVDWYPSPLLLEWAEWLFELYDFSSNPDDQKDFFIY